MSSTSPDEEPARAEVRYYSNLFNSPDPQANGDPVDDVNPVRIRGLQWLVCVR